MSSEILVNIDALSKKFCRTLRRSMWYGVTGIFRELTGQARPLSLRPEEFWALCDVGLEVRRGECLGLIGRNGAGKSTLLKLISGIIMPDAGRITVRGRVGALIQLGAGFHPILSGRENIYIKGAILGLGKKEIDRKLDQIVDFAEIGEALDSPLRTYSSGMVVRLGFSIAAHLDPDVFLIDEVLAVGDAGFRGRCYNRIESIRQKAAVVLVSHNMEHIGRICDRVAVLDQGKLLYVGPPDTGIAKYNALFPKNAFKALNTFSPIQSASLLLEEAVGDPDTEFQIAMDVESEESFESYLRLVLYAATGMAVAEGSSRTLERPVKIKRGRNRLLIQTGSIQLDGGPYFLSVTLHDRSAHDRLVVQAHQCLEVNIEKPVLGGHVVRIPIHSVDSQTL